MATAVAEVALPEVEAVGESALPEVEAVGENVAAKAEGLAKKGWSKVEDVFERDKPGEAAAKPPPPEEEGRGIMSHVVDIGTGFMLGQSLGRGTKPRGPDAAAAPPQGDAGAAPPPGDDGAAPPPGDGGAQKTGGASPARPGSLQAAVLAVLLIVVVCVFAYLSLKRPADAPLFVGGLALGAAAGVAAWLALGGRR